MSSREHFKQRAINYNKWQSELLSIAFPTFIRVIFVSDSFPSNRGSKFSCRWRDEVRRWKFSNPVCGGSWDFLRATCKFCYDVTVYKQTVRIIQRTLCERESLWRKEKAISWFFEHFCSSACVSHPLWRVFQESFFYLNFPKILVRICMYNFSLNFLKLIISIDSKIKKMSKKEEG